MSYTSTYNNNFYEPTNSSELIGNKNEIHIIKDWLINFNTLSNKDKANLIITGAHGIGKTTAISLIVKECGYNLINFDFDIIKNNKKINDYIDSLIKNNNILNLMSSTNKKKNIIIIDKLETITSTIQKKSLDILRKNNEKNRYLPIIFISNTQHTKFLSSLKKNCIVVEFMSPTNNELLSVIDKIIKKEKIKIKNNNIKTIIINYAQGDLRRLINIIKDIHYSYKSELIDLKIINEYIQNSKMKEMDIGLFESSEIIFNNFNNINDILTLYEMEKIKLPLTVHQHYLEYILSKDCKNDTNYKLDILKKISENLSYGDYVEYHVYNNQDWDMQEFHGFYTCAITSFYLNLLNKKNKFDKFIFPEDLHKTSIKNINKKNITNIKDWFNNCTSYDYIQMNKIIKHLLKQKDFSEIGKLLKDYKVNISHIESLLKIDKIIKSKNEGLTTKNKKELLKYL